MNTLEQHLRTQGKLWKTIARDFADATKDSQNDTLVYLRARLRFLEEEDKRIARKLESANR